MEAEIFDTGFFIFAIIFIFVIVRIVVRNAKGTGSSVSGSASAAGNGDVKDILCTYDNHVNHGGYVDPNEKNHWEELTYRRIRAIIASKRTYDEMRAVLDKHSHMMSSEMVFRLSSDIERLREKRKLY